MKTLKTDRLILRNWVESDIDDLYEYAKVEGVGEMAGWLHHTSIDISKEILADFIANDEVYAVVMKESNKVIGSLGVHNRSRVSNYQNDIQREIGYVLNKEYWGSGLMPEAVREVIKYAFDELSVDVLWCAHFTTNQQSKRVIEKSGFRYHCDGIYESIGLKKSFEEKIYIMTKADYKTRYR